MKRILAVTGITGHSGRFFLEELEKNRFDGVVRCLVRETSNIGPLSKTPLSIEKVVGSNRDYQTLLTLTKGADIVMHISNIHQSVDVVKACIENKVKRLVMVHTTGIYSQFKMASAEYKLIEDEIDLLRKKADFMDITILRPTMIFGDMCDHNIHKFIKMVDVFPIMPEIERGCGRIRPVNARDLAKAYYLVCMKEKLPESSYDLSGERSLTLHELFDCIGNLLGKKVRHLSCPMWLASIGANVIKSLTLGKIDYIERVLRMGEHRDYNHDAATRDFGYKPEVFDKGLEREVKEYLQIKVY